MSARGGAPGANSRGRGGKFKKFTRGGGKHFSRDLRPVDADGNEISMWSEDAQRQIGGGASDSGSGSESEEESGSDSEREGDQGALSREDRKKEKKARKEAAIARKKAMAVEVGDLPPSEDDDDDDDDDMLANPNHSKAARDMARDPVAEVADDVGKLSVGANRKERETAEAQAAKDRYQALHEQGKTDEAKADMARLRVIREQRAAEAARRQAEKEDKEAQEAARKAERDAKMAAIDKKKGGKKK